RTFRFVPSTSDFTLTHVARNGAPLRTACFSGRDYAPYTINIPLRDGVEGLSVAIGYKMRRLLQDCCLFAVGFEQGGCLFDEAVKLAAGPARPVQGSKRRLAGGGILAGR